jgi:hypothetical protein
MKQPLLGCIAKSSRPCAAWLVTWKLTGAVRTAGGAVDLAALWGHMPAHASMEALAASIRTFPLAPAPSLFSLAPVRASQQ